MAVTLATPSSGDFGNAIAVGKLAIDTFTNHTYIHAMIQNLTIQIAELDAYIEDMARRDSTTLSDADKAAYMQARRDRDALVLTQLKDQP
jgi:hypothetical protein